MKYIFIAGLEHSGTTLVNHLLSQHPDAIGLGEVASFFSPVHMQHYMTQWGNYSDARLCSCGEIWENCAFWKNMVGLSGLNSNLPLVEKYKHLIQYVKSNYKSENIVLIDSSKSLRSMKVLFQDYEKIGLKNDDLFIVFCVKDLRSFTASIARKRDFNYSFLFCLKTLNWWLGENKKFLAYLENNKNLSCLVLYEKFCEKPASVLNEIMKRINSDFLFPKDLRVDYNKSHIVMGNKSFLMRNREKISYDYGWFTEDKINLAYLLHIKARSFNKQLYANLP